MHTLSKKIVKFEVVSEAIPEAIPEAIHEAIHEAIPRPDRLIGSTYKLKTPESDHAIYITINDMLVNNRRVPYEIFINSKNMGNYQWMTAVTRLVSAVFRKGGDIIFLVDELKEIFDPKGGYFKKGGVYMPSLVAEIGYAIEQHMHIIGFIVPEVDEHTEAYLVNKRAELGVSDGEFPPQSQLCSKCNTKALVLMDGCMTCLSCGDSKCG